MPANTSASDTNEIDPNPAPVELRHVDDAKAQDLVFYDGSQVSCKVLLDKTEIVSLLFSLEPGDSIPTHTHDVDKAVHVLSGQVEAGFAGATATLSPSDSLQVPRNASSALNNRGSEAAHVFFFFSGGPCSALEFKHPEPGQTASENSTRLIEAHSIPWENWDGALASRDDSPLAWQTLINNENMILGLTKIDPDHDVDSHFHKQTQIIIFSEGEGKTHIEGNRYEPIGELSYIYPPSYSVHHSINTSASDPLLEIYFFPTGPFESVEYLFTK